VKFLPKCNNSLIATGAADSHIFVFDVNRHETPIFKCFCHFHRVKRLAVAPDMPDLFWSSAEDGQVLQFDIREPHQCRSDNPVVLLDLNNHSDSYVETKCIAVNPRKTYLMAVGANDVYARIYDRRMIVLNKVRSVENNRNFSHQTQNQDYKDNLVKGCCQYYAPGHLQNSDHFNKTITYIAFSPNGNEILANYGAEQIYLFDLNNAESPILLNLPKFPEIPTQRPQLNGEISKIKKVGNDHLETENYLSAIKAYSKGILLDPSCSILYHNRATALMRRKWNGDVYDALKDCHVALKLDPYYYKAHFRLARALLELNQLTLANEALMEFKKRFPAHDNDAVLELEHDINSALRNRGSSTSNREVTSELSDNEIVSNISEWDHTYYLRDRIF
jgi:WD and tetratricopeptide repeat-containing protein 1